MKARSSARDSADPAAAAYAELVGFLSRLRRRLALVTLAGGLVRWLCVAGAGLGVALGLAALLPSSVAGSLTLSLAWLSLAITTFAYFIVAPFLRLPGVEGLAVRLDSSQAPGSNRLISALQLGRALRRGEGGMWISVPITRKAVEVGARALGDMDANAATSDPGVGRWIRQSALVALFFAAMVALWPGEIRTSVWRLTNPMACGPVPVSLTAGPGNVEVDAGSDLIVEAIVFGTDQAPELRVRKRGGVWKRVTMPSKRSPYYHTPGGFVSAPTDDLTGAGADERTGPAGQGSSGVRSGPGAEPTPSEGLGAGADSASDENLASVETPYGRRELPRHFYAYTLERLQEDREYGVTVSGVQSPTWVVEVNQPPRAVAFRIGYSFPDYTGLPPHESVSASGDVAALKGAAVEVEVSANRGLEGARLVFVGPAAETGAPEGGSGGRSDSGPGGEAAGPKTVEMTPTSDRSFVGAFRLMQEGSYTVTFVEPGGRERPDPRTFRITPLPDHGPMVRILSPDRYVDLPTEMTVEVSAYAADDYGITSMALVHFMEGGEETRLPVQTYSSAPRELYESYTWDLTEIGLLPGEVLFYSIEVYDNDTVSGPKASRSEVHSLRFPTMAEIYQRVEEGYEEGIDELAEQLRRGRELKERLEEISREMKRSDGLSWEQRQSIKGAVGDREKLAEAAKQVAESLDEIVEKMGGTDFADEEFVEKMMEIQKLLSEISDPELKKAIEKLNQALADVDEKAVAEAMEKLKLDQEDLLKRLDKTIELLKRLKAEESINAAREKIEDLLRKQESINESLEKDDLTSEDLKEMSAEEGEIKDGLAELETSLSELQKELEEIDPQMAEEMGAQAEKASESGLQRDAQQASQRMASGSRAGAMQSGEKVAKGLSAMSEEMQLAAESMRQRQARQMAEKLGEAAKDLVYISKGQEAMVASSDATSPQELARTQFQIHSGAAQVADELEEVIRGSFAVSRKLGNELGDALHKMEKATDEFEAGKKQSGLASGWEALPSLNKAAMQLMKTSSDLMSMSSCSSPMGSEGARQEMEKLCGMQREVNSGTQGLMPKLTGQGGRLQHSTQDQLANLAARQEMIKKGMQEVAGELGGRKDILGRLDDLAEEMQKVIDDMERGNVDRETIRRQQKILSRLLDAQRSVRRRDTDNERISRVGADDFERTPPGAIPPEMLDAEDRMKSEVLQGKADPIPPAYRRLVEEYFRAISARGN